jgi:acid phosphatase type 7
LRLRLAFAALMALPHLATAASIVRGPFLQQTTPTSTIVVVTTDAAASVEATARLPGGGTVSASSTGTTHLLRLAGLTPASAISYAVTVDGAAKASATFRTPGVPGTEAARHAVIGATADTGSAGPNARAAVARLQALGVEAVLTMGDNSYPDGAASEWTYAFFGVWKPFMGSATLWTGVGDHEYRTPFAQPYLDSVMVPEGPQGKRYYSFDWGDVHVAALDTNCIVPMDKAAMGCDQATMVAWLEKDLAATKALWKIVTMHRPAVATGKYGVYPQIPAALLGPFERGGVDLVLQAHNHLYERTWPTRQNAVVKKDYDHPGAPVYVTSGGGSDYLYDSVLAAASWTAMRATAAHVMKLTLDGGSLKVEAVQPDGKLLDAIELVKDVPPVSVPGDPVPVDPTTPGGTGGGTGNDDGTPAIPDPTPELGPDEGGRCQSGSAAGLMVLAPVLAAWAFGKRRRRVVVRVAVQGYAVGEAPPRGRDRLPAAPRSAPSNRG